MKKKAMLTMVSQHWMVPAAQEPALLCWAVLFSEPHEGAATATEAAARTVKMVENCMFASKEGLERVARAERVVKKVKKVKQ